MNIHHIIFTRFAIQNIFRQGIDVYDDDYISSRFTLLKIFCFPALQSQSTQDFSWVLVVDENLPKKWFIELSNFVSQRARSYIVTYPGKKYAHDTEWISHLIPSNTDRLITSYLDDDDSLPRNFIEVVHRDINESHAKARLNPLKMLASGQTIQWDMIFKEDAPFGYRCPWHRHSVQATSCGFSLCCKYPELPMTVFGMRHKAAFHYLSFEEEPNYPDIAAFREELKSRCDSLGLEFKGAHTDNWRDVSQTVGPALATNHAKNSEETRLLEEKSTYKKVEGRESFHEFAIDWGELLRNVNQFAARD